MIAMHCKESQASLCKYKLAICRQALPSFRLRVLAPIHGVEMQFNETQFHVCSDQCVAGLGHYGAHWHQQHGKLATCRVARVQGIYSDTVKTAHVDPSRRILDFVSRKYDIKLHSDGESRRPGKVHRSNDTEEQPTMWTAEALPS